MQNFNSQEMNQTNDQNLDRIYISSLFEDLNIPMSSIQDESIVNNFEINDKLLKVISN